MNREQELNYIVERFAQKFKESQHKYPFLSDPKIQEGFLKLLAETIMEDSQLLNALNELGYDKVKTLLQPLIDQAFAKMEEKIEEVKKEVERNREVMSEQHGDMVKFQAKHLGGLYEFIGNSRDAILSSVSEMKSNMMTKKDAQDLNWLNSRTW